MANFVTRLMKNAMRSYPISAIAVPMVGVSFREMVVCKLTIKYVVLWNVEKKSRWHVCGEACGPAKKSVAKTTPPQDFVARDIRYFVWIRKSLAVYKLAH